MLERKHKSLVTFLIGAALLVFAVRLWFCFAPAYYAGVDESSYFLTARAIAETGSPAIHSGDPLLFTPMNLIEVRPGVFYQKYPVGYPLMVAVGYRLGGVDGAFLVNPILGLCCVLFATLLALDMFGRWPAIVVAFSMALHPAVLFYSNSALSHIGDTCFVVLGLWLLWRWINRGGLLLSIAASISLGYAASIRNSEVLLVVVMAWALWVRMREGAMPVRQMLAACAAMSGGYLAGLAPNLVYQWSAFGGPLVSGYEFTGESSAFSFSGLLQHAPGALGMLNTSSFGLPVLLPFAIAFAGYACFRLARRQANPSTRAAMFLSLWVVPTFLLYSAYYWTSPHPELYLRLFLSTYPAIVIGAAGLAHLAGGWPRVRIAVGVVSIATCALLMVRADEQVLESSTLAWITRQGSDAVRRESPAGSVLIADGVSAYFLAFSTDCDIYSPGNFDEAWVAAHSAMTKQQPPLEMNRLRADRYFALVANRSQGELAALLRERLRARLAAAQPAILLTSSLDRDEAQVESDWARRLSPDFQLCGKAKGAAGWLVYRITSAQ